MKKLSSLALVLVLGAAARAEVGPLDPGMPLTLLRKQAVVRELSPSRTQVRAIAALLAQADKGPAEAVKANTRLRDTLLADQAKRLNEISYQVRGGSALLDEPVVSALALTAKQKEEIKKAWDQSEARLLAFLMTARFASAGARDAHILKHRRTTGEALLGLLDAAQKKRFTTLQGKPFDLKKLDTPG